MLTADFWRDTLVRAVKTFAQTLAALLAADGTDLLSTDWGSRLSVAGMAALVSALTTIASSAATGSPAVGEAVTPNAAVAAAQSTPDAPIEAGPAATETTGIPQGAPVDVIPAEPQTYSGDSKRSATYGSDGYEDGTG
jgi:hypothetical protein